MVYCEEFGFDTVGRMFVGTWPVTKIQLTSNLDGGFARAAVVLEHGRPVVLETRIRKDDWEFALRHGVVECVSDKGLSIEDLMTEDGD